MTAKDDLEAWNKRTAELARQLDAETERLRQVEIAAKEHLVAWDLLKAQMGDTWPDGPKTARLRSLLERRP